MTSNQLKKALAQLGLTQIGFASVIRVNDRTVRNWIGGRSEVPTHIAMLLNMAIDTDTDIHDWRDR